MTLKFFNYSSHGGSLCQFMDCPGGEKRSLFFLKIFSKRSEKSYLEDLKW